MEKVDLVIVGAEGVVENGGIINKVRKAVVTLIHCIAGTPYNEIQDFFPAWNYSMCVCAPHGQVMRIHGYLVLAHS